MMLSHPGPAEPQTFQRDHHLRRRLGFAEATFEHKAKLNLNWLAWLLNEHTDPGSVVLDPLAGTGSILLAALNQHPTLAGDVEAYWSRLLSHNALRIRREWCYRLVRDELVAKFGLVAGDQLELHVTDRYARYLQQRLNTFGAVATIPTAHRNLGQKLAWYTERIK